MTELRPSRRQLLGGALGAGALAGLSACGLQDLADAVIAGQTTEITTMQQLLAD